MKGTQSTQSTLGHDEQGLEKMKSQTFSNVFDALAATPGEAATMKARSELLSALKARVRAWDLPQEVAAHRLGMTRPHLDDLLRGKMGKFSLDALVSLTAVAGLELHIRVGNRRERIERQTAG